MIVRLPRLKLNSLQDEARELSRTLSGMSAVSGTPFEVHRGLPGAPSKERFNRWGVLGNVVVGECNLRGVYLPPVRNTRGHQFCPGAS
jgi:hypothetical protein